MTTKGLKGLSCNVFRCGLGDCTNGGVTATADNVVLVGKGLEGYIEPTDTSEPVLFLKWWKPFGNTPAFPIAVPEDLGDEHPLGGKWMFGGNFIFSSDSRFRKGVAPQGWGQPVPVYDRKEW